MVVCLVVFVRICLNGFKKPSFMNLLPLNTMLHRISMQVNSTIDTIHLPFVHLTQHHAPCD
jgi:hypothetical protein